MNVPFTVQSCNLHNYPPEPFRRVYYSPAAQDPMSTALTVLFSTLHVRMMCGLTAGSSRDRFLGTCVCEYHICCDLSRSVELMAQTANVSFMFKV